MKKLIAIAAIFFAFTTATVAQDTKTFYSTSVSTALVLIGGASPR